MSDCYVALQGRSAGQLPLRGDLSPSRCCIATDWAPRKLIREHDLGAHNVLNRLHEPKLGVAHDAAVANHCWHISVGWQSAGLDAAAHLLLQLAANCWRHARKTATEALERI